MPFRLLASVGCSKIAIARLLAGELDDVGVTLHLVSLGQRVGLRDQSWAAPCGRSGEGQGQLAIGRRFEELLSDKWEVTDETLLPRAGVARAWDKLLRLRESRPPHLVGVDIETRVRDV